MRFTLHRRRNNSGFEAIPAEGEPYRRDFYPTAHEVKIIALAAVAGEEDIELPVVYDDGTQYVNFCGSCGRMICHPSCPRLSWNEDNRSWSQRKDTA